MIEGLHPKATPIDEVLTLDKEGNPLNGTFNNTSRRLEWCGNYVAFQD